jgi:MFS_1 like family
VRPCPDFFGLGSGCSNTLLVLTATNIISDVRFREVGCSTSDMGMSRLLSSLAGAVVFFFSGDLNMYLGMRGSMVMCVLAGASRMLLVMSMDRPSSGYVAEILRGGIYGTLWSTCTLYAGDIGPASSRPVILLLLNGAYYGIGRSVGSIIGGKLQMLVGTKAVFFYFSLVNAVLFVTLTVYYFGPKRRKTGPSAIIESKKQQ